MPAPSGFAPLAIPSPRGPVEGRLWGPLDAERAVVLVGGVGGGWDTPSGELYPRLATSLAAEGVAALRLRFRNSTDLEEATSDVVAGARFLAERGALRLGLVGWSFGGAVVLRAAAKATGVRTVATIATQSYGAEPVRAFEGSVLLLHGTRDAVLPPHCSVAVERLAGGPARLELLEGADHGLRGAEDAAFERLRAWLLGEL